MANAYAFSQFDQVAVSDATPTALLAAARQEADELRERARLEGRQAGYEDGLAQGLADCAQLSDTFKHAVDELEQARAQLLESLTRQGAQLAITIAEQILSAALELQPERVLDVTRGAIRRLNERSRVTVSVNPDDLALVRDHAEQLRLELGGIGHLDIQADRRIGRGGALVATETGEIDCSLEAQLQTVHEIVTAALRTPPEAERHDDERGPDE